MKVADVGVLMQNCGKYLWMELKGMEIKPKIYS